MAQGFDKTEPIFESPLVSEIVRTNFNASATHHSGSSSPSNPELGWIWLDTAIAANKKLKVYNGTTWVVILENIDSITSLPTAPGGGTQYIHTQVTLASSWVIAHNLGKKYLNIVVVNGSDQNLDPSGYTTTYTDNNNLTINFPGNTSGKAILS